MAGPQSPPVAPPAVPIRVDPDPLGAYVRWARFFFLLLAAVTVIGLVLLAAAGSLATWVGVEPDQLAAALPSLLVAIVGVVLNLGAIVSMIRGLGARRPWAIHAVAPVCTLLIVFGVGRSLIALTQNQFLIPLEAIAALLVLTRPHGPDIMPAQTADDARRVTLVTVAIAVATVLPAILTQLSR